MGGVNPYIRPVRPVKPSQPFEVTFRVEETGLTKTVTVRPEDLPFGDHGLIDLLLIAACALGGLWLVWRRAL